MQRVWSLSKLRHYDSWVYHWLAKLRRRLEFDLLNQLRRRYFYVSRRRIFLYSILVVIDDCILSDFTTWKSLLSHDCHFRLIVFILFYTKTFLWLDVLRDSMNDCLAVIFLLIVVKVFDMSFILRSLRLDSIFLVLKRDQAGSLKKVRAIISDCPDKALVRLPLLELIQNINARLSILIALSTWLAIVIRALASLDLNSLPIESLQRTFCRLVENRYLRLLFILCLLIKYLRLVYSLVAFFVKFWFYSSD